VETICRKEGEETSFVFIDVEPEYEDVLRGLFYMPVQGGFAKTFPTSTPDLDRIYGNFERHAREIVVQAARIDPVDWRGTLAAFLELVDGLGIDWWLCGSTALAVRGIDVAPGDLDLVVDDDGARELSGMLSDYLVEPLQSPESWICSSFGRAFLGARLEWVGGVNESADTPEVGDFGPVAAERLEAVDWRGTEVRVPPLDLQLEVSERRGLADRADKIRAFMLGERTKQP